MLHTIYFCEKPTIALVNGPALGGGVGIVAACDIAIAADDAIFGLTEVRVGLIPAVISPFVMRAMGTRQARRFFMTGERFDADTARRISLVHLVAIAPQLEATLDGVIKDLLACGPVAQKEAKDLIRAVAFQPIDDRIMEETAARIARLRSSPEGKEGVLSEADDLRALRPLNMYGYSKHLFKPHAWGTMADSETFAHLEHLRQTGRATARTVEGELRYRLAD